METHWIVEIVSVMFMMPTQEFGVTLMMTISLKLVIYQKGFILERLTQNILMSGSPDVLFIFYIITIHLNKYSSFFSRIRQHVQNQSYEESNSISECL